jgi:hypothetical protein
MALRHSLLVPGQLMHILRIIEYHDEYLFVSYSFAMSIFFACRAINAQAP